MYDGGVPESMCPRDLEVEGRKDNFQGLMFSNSVVAPSWGSVRDQLTNVHRAGCYYEES